MILNHWLFAILISTLATFHGNDSDELSKLLLKFDDGGSKTIVGEILDRNDITIEILDIRTGEKLKFAVGEIDRLEEADDPSFNIKYAGLPRYLAWKISRHPSMATPKGKIAAIDSGIIYANLGEKSGVHVGQLFSVFSQGEEIKDPDTGAVIGNTRRKIAELKLIQIDKQVSKFSRSDEMESQLEIGTEIVAAPKSVAVLPFFNAQGLETVDSRRISEEILTTFVESELNVVERRLLDKVVGEIGLQQGIAFDDATAVKVGKLLGADFILTGTATLLNNGQTRYASRLIDVQTGKIVFAVASDDNPTANSAAGGSFSLPAPGSSQYKTVQLNEKSGVLIEAEDFFRLIPPMSAVRDNRASGHRYIHLPRMPFNRGSVIYVINVPRAGKWYVWAKVLAPSGGENSVYLKINQGGKEIEIVSCHFAKTTSFQWQALDSIRTISNGIESPTIHSPEGFQLPNGLVELHIGGREPRTAIDSIFISPSSNIKP